MDYKQLRKIIAEDLDRPAADIDALIEGLSIIIRESASDMDSVAIPTFGTFVPKKLDEEISVDLSTGKRMLFPPEIHLEFKTGGMLTKRLRNE